MSFEEKKGKDFTLPYFALLRSKGRKKKKELTFSLRFTRCLRARFASPQKGLSSLTVDASEAAVYMRAPLLKDTKLVFAGIPVTMVAAPERSPEVGLIEAYLIVEGIKPEEEDAHQRKPGMEWGGNGFFLGERLKKKRKTSKKEGGSFSLFHSQIHRIKSAF